MDTSGSVLHVGDKVQCPLNGAVNIVVLVSSVKQVALVRCLYRTSIGREFTLEAGTSLTRLFSMKL